MSRRRALRMATPAIATILCSLVSTPGQTADRPDAAPPVPSFLRGVSLEALKATRERPLFAPSRRPPRIAAPAAPAVSPIGPAPVPSEVAEAPRLTLLGIIRAPDNSGSAVVMDETNSTSVSLRPGEGRRGWVVRSIGTDTVTLQKQDRTVDLSFLKGQSPALLRAPRLPAE